MCSKAFFFTGHGLYILFFCSTAPESGNFVSRSGQKVGAFRPEGRKSNLSIHYIFSLIIFNLNRYIKERKEALQKEQLAKIAAKPKDCPTGHIPLPDNERKETLSMLKKSKSETIKSIKLKL